MFTGHLLSDATSMFFLAKSEFMYLTYFRHPTYVQSRLDSILSISKISFCDSRHLFLCCKLEYWPISKKSSV